MRMKLLACFAVPLLVGLGSCTQKSPRMMTGADSLHAVNESMNYRRMAEDFFREHPDSPFRTTPPVPFEGLRWYPRTPGFYFTSKLTRYELPDTVIVSGTKGEPEKADPLRVFHVAGSATRTTG